LKYKILKVLILTVIFTLSSSFVSTSEETEGQDFIVQGYIKDKSGINSLEGVAVALKVYEINEQLLTVTDKDGYYRFSLNDLEKGWRHNYTITISSVYNDYEDDERYYRGYSFYLDAEKNFENYTLVLNNYAGLKQYMERSMSSMSKYMGSNENLTVFLSGDNFGSATLIWETIPDGFEFKNCSLAEYQYEYFPDNHTLMFIVTKEEKNFEYNVTTSKQEGEYVFDGHFVDFTKNRFDITGDKEIHVYVITPYIEYEKIRMEHTNGSIVSFTAEAVGGTAPYTFWWKNSTEDEYSHKGKNLNLNYDKGGNYTMILKAIDSNVIEATTSINFTIYTDLEVLYNGTFSVEKNTYNWFNVSSRGGVAPIYYSWDIDNDGAYDDGNGEAIQLILDEIGNNRIAVKAFDSYGPPHEDILTLDIYCTDTKVIFDTSLPADGAVEKNVDKLFLIFKENVTLIESKIDNQEVDFETGDNMIFGYFNISGLGTHTIKIKAEDEYENIGWFNLSFIVDDIPPVLEIQECEEKITSETDILVNSYDNESSIKNIIFEIFKISDDGSEKISEYNLTEEPYTITVDPDEFDDGEYSFKATAYDQAGNTNSEMTDVKIEKQGDNVLMDYLWLIVIIVIIAIVAIIYTLFKKK